MAALETLNSLSKRGHFKIIKDALSASQLPTSNGWKKTIDKLTPLFSNSNSQSSIDDATIKIDNILINSILYANKSCQLYKISEVQTEQIKNHFTNEEVQVTFSPFSESYPLSLDTVQLNEQPLSPLLSHIYHQENKITLIYCSKRYFTSKEDIFVSELSEEAQQDLSDYEVLVGVKRDVYQAYDSVYIDLDKNLIILKIDRSDELSALEITRNMNTLSEVFLEYIQQQYCHDFNFTPINIFPAIQKLYNTSDGKVTGLGHLTNTASSKLEKMKFKRDDLRREPYHNGGKQAVNNLINCYHISKIWHEGELHICGRSSLISHETPEIFIAQIYQVINGNNFQSIIDKLLIALE